MNLINNISRTPVKCIIFTNFMVFPKRLQAVQGAVAYINRLDGCTHLICDLDT